jgi:DNA-binding transcriptional ArsR family regulator
VLTFVTEPDDIVHYGTSTKYIILSVECIFRNKNEGCGMALDGYEQVAALTKALAHPVRLQILQILRTEGEACVCHLEALLGQRQPYISQQLMRLRDAGLVVDRREGMNVFYALADERIASVLDAALEAVQTLAATGGETLTFPIFDRIDTRTCPCPNCQSQAEGLVGQAGSRA